MVNDYDYDYEGTELPVSKKDYSKIEQKNNTCINGFCYRNNLVHPVYISDKKDKHCMDWLLITDGNKSHYVYIKGFNIFMCNKTKNKDKNHFWKYCLQCFRSEKVFQEQKKTCLKMNSKQSVKIESGLIKFKNYVKQLDVPFKVYVDFESILKWIKQNNRKTDTSHIRKFQNHIQSCLYWWEI